MKFLDRIDFDSLVFGVMGFFVGWVLVSCGIFGFLFVMIITMIFVKYREKISDWILRR